MTQLSFDELNKLGYEPRAIPYDEYFGEMELSKEQVDERIGFAEAIESELSTALNVIAMMLALGLVVDYESLKSSLIDRYCVIAVQSTDDYDWILSRATDFADEFFSSTADHLGEAWYTSDDRAMFNAENEANTVLNYTDYLDAVLGGAKQKQWISMVDQRTRDSHARTNGKVIPIDEYFTVGDSLMLFPKDLSMDPDPKEYIGCRCSVKYF